MTNSTEWLVEILLPGGIVGVVYLKAESNGSLSRINNISGAMQSYVKCPALVGGLEGKWKRGRKARERRQTL